MLYIGEVVGGGGSQEVDIAVDPLEGTNLVAKGLPGAISVIAVTERGGILHAPDIYMDKLIVGPTCAGQVDIRAPVEENLASMASAYRRTVGDLTITILDRPRHADLIKRVREAGAPIKMISPGDVSAAIAAAGGGTPGHAVMGIGGAPEGVLAAAALRCLGGQIQGRFWFRNDEERKRVQSMGIVDPDRVFDTKDLVPGDSVVFVATGITDGDLLRGVRFFGGGARTHSLVMTRQTGDPGHRRARLRRLTGAGRGPGPVLYRRPSVRRCGRSGQAFPRPRRRHGRLAPGPAARESRRRPPRGCRAGAVCRC